MQAGIAIIVLGAIGLIIFAAVTPTLFGSFADTFQQTQAACVYKGERFTSVNSMAKWSGKSTTVTNSGGTTCTVTGATEIVYTPHGVALTVTSNALPSDAAWEEALMIMTEQGGINRLVITILPLLTIIGAIGLLYSWHRGRQTA